jgi:tetratricopeptide (TPR) repeat protein
MSLSVQIPAPVTLPGDVKSIGIVDRRAGTTQSKITDAVDKIFSLESPKLDSIAADRTMIGLKDELLKLDRFNEIVLVSEHLNTVNPTQFPTPLSWETVSGLCRDNDVDLLFALELFDTDSKITYAVQPVKLNTIVGNIPAVEHQASMRTLVKSGWRIYDPVSKEILDEFAVSNSISYTGRGINPVAAANAIIGRGEAVKAVGYETGKAYAGRIIPRWIRVSRDYYVKGTDRFAIAKRKAQTGNWDKAAELWQQETTNSQGKIVGRACYNMAIINEINGNLPKAIEWAQLAYENYNNKLALRYVNILKRRLQGEQILQDQESMLSMER